jgi:glycosyltransferase involved in cell wall biosynthesis
MDYKKITVVTPTFNSSKYLEETILSIINQNYPNLEYIIMDGGSTDSTLEIIKKYEKNIFYWESEPDNGMYHAIMKGFEKSSGEIMAWLNSDDMYHRGSLFMVNQVFSNFDDVEWVTGIPSHYNRDGLCVQTGEGRKWTRSRFLLGDYKWLQQESIFWRRTLWDRTGSELSMTYKYACDFELWCRFFQSAQICNLRTLLGGFRIHGEQISYNFSEDYEKEAGTIFNQYFPANESIFRLRLLKPAWNIRNYLSRSDNKLSGILSSMLTRMVDMINESPLEIVYDFIADSWEKKR